MTNPTTATGIRTGLMPQRIALPQEPAAIDESTLPSFAQVQELGATRPFGENVKTTLVEWRENLTALFAPQSPQRQELDALDATQAQDLARQAERMGLLKSSHLENANKELDITSTESYKWQAKAFIDRAYEPYKKRNVAMESSDWQYTNGIFDQLQKIIPHLYNHYGSTQMVAQSAELAEFRTSMPTYGWQDRAAQKEFQERLLCPEFIELVVRSKQPERHDAMQQCLLGAAQPLSPRHVQLLDWLAAWQYLRATVPPQIPAQKTPPGKNADRLQP